MLLNKCCSWGISLDDGKQGQGLGGMAWHGINCISRRYLI